MGTINVGSGAGGPSKHKPPDSYKLLGEYTSNTTWTAPEKGWYRVYCFGASGKGGKGGWSNKNGAPGGGAGGGGGSGGLAISDLFLNRNEVIEITANLIASFGNYLSATNGSDGGNGKDNGAGGGAAGVGGTAINGNLLSANGYPGGAGGNSNGAGKAGGNNGGKGGAAGGGGGRAGGGGGGGARYADTELAARYILADITGKNTLNGGYGEGTNYHAAVNGQGYYQYVYPAIQMSGGGGGGGGGVDNQGGKNGGAGQPATVIIEQGVYN